MAAAVQLADFRLAVALPAQPQLADRPPPLAVQADGAVPAEPLTVPAAGPQAAAAGTTDHVTPPPQALPRWTSASAPDGPAPPRRPSEPPGTAAARAAGGRPGPETLSASDSPPLPFGPRRARGCSSRATP